MQITIEKYIFRHSKTECVRIRILDKNIYPRPFENFLKIYTVLK